MKKHIKMLISTIAIISVILIGKETIKQKNTTAQIDDLESKIESLEKDLQEQKELAKELEKIEKDEQQKQEPAQESEEKPIQETKEENFYNINNLRIIEKTYKDGNTKKSLVIATTTTSTEKEEFKDIPELSEIEYTKNKMEFYSILTGETKGYQETIILSPNEEIYATYEKIEYDTYQITRRQIQKPEKLTKHNYENISDNVEIKIYTLKEILDESLIKAEYTFQDILKIIIELDGEVENKIGDIITNKLIKHK